MRDFLRERIKAMPAFVGFAVVGATLLWFGLSGLLSVVRPLETNAPLISFDPHDVICLPLALSFFAVAAMTLLPVPEIGRRRVSNAKRRRFDGGALCIGIAIIGGVGAFISPAIGTFIVEFTTAKHGYIHCPPQLYNDGQLRWIHVGTDLSQTHCPTKEERP